MKNYYPHEKFSIAIQSMAKNPACLQVRLAEAYIHNLFNLNINDLPKEIHSAFKKLHKDIKNYSPTNDNEKLNDSILKMHMNEAINIINDIINMAYIVDREYYES